MASLDVDGWEVSEFTDKTIRASGPSGWIYCGIKRSVSGPEYDLELTVSVNGELVHRDTHAVVPEPEDALTVVEREAEKIANGAYD